MRIPIQVIRSARKTLSIQIEDDASVLIRAPKGLPKSRIQAFVKEKQEWIRKNVRTQRKRAKKAPKHTFDSGDEFEFLGKKITLAFSPKRSVVKRGEKLIAPKGTKAQTKKRVEAWFKKQARQLFEDRIEYYCKRMDTQCAGLRLSSARRRWGSCNHKNGVNLNWRLIMAPRAVIDSVIVHELAHTKHKNHSKRFWNLVLRYCPNYKLHKHWLKDNEYLLSWD